MKKALLIVIPVMMAIVPLFLYAQNEEILIDNAAFGKKSRKPVVFSHMKHREVEGISCTDCHHHFVFLNSSMGRRVLCRDCHRLVEKGESLPADSGLEKDLSCSGCHKGDAALEKAYHRQCIGCHEKQKKMKKAAGPVMCGECHK